MKDCAAPLDGLVECSLRLDVLDDAVLESLQSFALKKLGEEFSLGSAPDRPSRPESASE